jgi:hypothetical protein
MRCCRVLLSTYAIKLVSALGSHTFHPLIYRLQDNIVIGGISLQAGGAHVRADPQSRVCFTLCVVATLI